MSKGFDWPGDYESQSHYLGYGLDSRMRDEMISPEKKMETTASITLDKKAIQEIITNFFAKKGISPTDFHFNTESVFTGYGISETCTQEFTGVTVNYKIKI